MAVVNFEIYKVLGTLSENKMGGKSNLLAPVGGVIILNSTFVPGTVNIMV